MRKIVEMGLAALVIALAAAALESSISASRDERQLQAALADQRKIISSASARELQRDEALRNVTDDIANLKRKIRTPEQVVQEMPKYLRLPQPITMSDSAFRSASAPKSMSLFTRKLVEKPQVPEPSSPDAPLANIPTVDLKPLFDVVQDCRVCQDKVAAANQDAADEGTKLAAVTRERDLAIKAAKGGGFWQRLRRDLTWLAAGAAAGYAAGHGSK